MTSQPTTTTTAPATGTVRAIHPSLILGIVLTAVFVQLLDISIVNVAVPSIQTDLGASFSAVQLVLSGYQLAFACTLITAARLGDIYGRKRLFMSGMAVFTVASLLCGLAPDATTLVLARVLQGFGSGLMFPQVLAVIQVTFAPRERGKAFGVFGATIGLATILGPVIGGILIKANLFGTDWRMIFLVNIPVGLGALLLAARELPESRAPDAPSLDLPGAGLITVGLFLLVYPLIEGRTRGWPLWLDLMLAAALPVLAAFVLLQQRKTRASRDPLILMTLFANPSFRAGVLLSTVFFLGVAPFFFTFSLYLQVGLGYDALHSGLTTLPFALGSGIASARSDGIARRLGRDVLTIGCALLVVAMAALIAVLHLAGTGLHSWQVAPVLFVAGLGLGLFIAPLTTLVLAGIQGREAGSASGVLSSVQQVGGALGVAVIGVVLFGLVGGGAADSARGATTGLPDRLVAAGLPREQAVAATEGFQTCFAQQANATDPSRTPPGCQARSGPSAPLFAAAARTATANTWLRAVQRTLVLEVVVFLAGLLLSRLLPKLPAPTGRGAPADA